MIHAGNAVKISQMVFIRKLMWLFSLHSVWHNMSGSLFLLPCQTLPRIVPRDVREETSRLQSFCMILRKWKPTPVFLPGESQGRGSLVGCRLWGHTESDTTEATQQQQQRVFRAMVRWKEWRQIWGSQSKPHCILDSPPPNPTPLLIFINKVRWKYTQVLMRTKSWKPKDQRGI